MDWRGRNRRERDLERELRAHLDLEAAEQREAGLSAQDAYYAAQRAFGNSALVTEEVREMWRWTSLERLAQDLRYGVRILRLNPAFALVAIFSLALGIGANTSIFQLLDALRLRLLPVRNPQELVQIRLAEGDGGCCSFDGRYPDLTNPLWQQLQSGQRAFSGMFAWSPVTFNLATDGEPRYAQGIWVSGAFFNVLGVEPLVGRVFSEADDRRGCGSSSGVVVSYDFWQRELAGSPSVLGRTVTLDGYRFDVIGVTPANFYGVEVGHTFDVAVPICAEPVLNSNDSNLDRRWAWWLAVVGRLKPGWSVQRAAAHLEALSPGIFQVTEPMDLKVTNYLRFRLSAFPVASGFSVLRERYASPLLVLMSLAALTLLIACLNLANLALARASARAREMAIRLSLGASRGRLIRQLMVESLVISTAGAALGVCIAPALSRVLVSSLSTQKSPLFVDLRLDWRVPAFAFALGLMTCLLFGVAPALRASRTRLSQAMKSGGHGLSGDRAGLGPRRLLVVAQVALSLVLLNGALLFVRTFYNLATLDVGFRQNGILVANVDLSRVGVPETRRVAFIAQVLGQVRHVPGVLSAAATRIVPLSGDGWTQYVLINGSSQGGKLNSRFTTITTDYFRTLGIPLEAGRDFDEGDVLTSPRVAIVNRSFVRHILDGADPIGKVFGLRLGNELESRYRIVGVVGDTKYADLREQFGPIAYLPASQDGHPRQVVHILVRAGVQPASLASATSRAISQIDPQIGTDFHVFRLQIRDSMVRERLMATLSGFFGVLATLLTALGLFGVMSYTVARRASEIGLRIAVGARRRDVVLMVMRESAILLGVGVAAGLIMALTAATAASTLIYGLKPRDPESLLIAVSVLAAIALVSAWAPAHRAAALDPMTVLRED